MEVSDRIGQCNLLCIRHGRARPGHPRLAYWDAASKTWMPATSAGMTKHSVIPSDWNFAPGLSCTTPPARPGF